MFKETEVQIRLFVFDQFHVFSTHPRLNFPVQNELTILKPFLLIQQLQTISTILDVLFVNFNNLTPFEKKFEYLFGKPLVRLFFFTIKPQNSLKFLKRFVIHLDPAGQCFDLHSLETLTGQRGVLIANDEFAIDVVVLVEYLFIQDLFDDVLQGKDSDALFEPDGFLFIVIHVAYQRSLRVCYFLGLFTDVSLELLELVLLASLLQVVHKLRTAVFLVGLVLHYDHVSLLLLDFIEGVVDFSVFVQVDAVEFVHDCVCV